MSEPTVPEGGNFPLPPELQQILQQHPGWGLIKARQDGEPPFVGPLHAAPSVKELDLKTAVQHQLTSRMFNVKEPTELDEFNRVLQQCYDGICQLVFAAPPRWDDQGLWFFVTYNTPTRQLKQTNRVVPPVSPQ